MGRVETEMIPQPKTEPVCEIGRFRVFRLPQKRRIIRNKQVIEFMIKGEQMVEKIIVSCKVNEENELWGIKVFRKKNFDKELSGYLVEAFVMNFLHSSFQIRKREKFKYSRQPAK